MGKKPKKTSPKIKKSKPETLYSLVKFPLWSMAASFLIIVSAFLVKEHLLKPKQKDAESLIWKYKLSSTRLRKRMQSLYPPDNQETKITSTNYFLKEADNLRLKIKQQPGYSMII
jgi:hypothetical protein